VGNALRERSRLPLLAPPKRTYRTAMSAQTVAPTQPCI